MSRNPLRGRIYLLVAALTVAWILPARGGADVMLALLGVEVPLLQDTGVQPPECTVKSITKIAIGTRPDWSPEGRLIGYDARVKGIFQVFLVNPDGSNAHCITCGRTVPDALRGKHKGKTTFHPNGQYVLFGAENENGDHSFMTTPGVGDDHDLWVTDLGGRVFWRLTSSPPGSALQYPRFSGDGRKLLWSERYEQGRFTTTGDEFGLWKMKMADFVVTPDGPALANIVDLEPGGPGYYEPHGFSSDGSTIIFTAVIDPGKSQFYGEIYTFDLATGRLTNLARAADIHFEQALYSPSGKKISLMSGPFLGLLRWYKSDLYVMDADGGNRMRLTYFNEPGHPEYMGATTLIAKDVWSPDGRNIVVGTQVQERAEHAVRIISLEGPCGALER